MNYYELIHEQWKSHTKCIYKNKSFSGTSSNIFEAVFVKILSTIFSKVGFRIAHRSFQFSFSDCCVGLAKNRDYNKF